MSQKSLILPRLRRTAEDARQFAYAAHKGQLDKAGRPYTTHLGRVHERFVDNLGNLPQSRWDDAFQVCWLHDVIEDTEYDADHLRKEGFSDDVVHAVEVLTKPKWQPYDKFISDIVTEGEIIEVLVKMADVEDNSDPKRLSLLDQGTRERLKLKYKSTLIALRLATMRLGWSPSSPVSATSNERDEP